MRHGLAALTAALLLLAACDYTPSALGDWRESPSCGSFENRNQRPSAKQEQAVRCLLDAFAEGRSAELVATYYGEEGGRTTEYFRVLGPHRIEIFVDGTADVEGSQRWSHQLCDNLESDLWFVYADPAGCREISVDEVVTAGYG